MTIIPFACLGSGILLGILVKSKQFAVMSDRVSTVALTFLMLSIGLGIGLDQSIIDQLGRIGLNCVVISACAIAFSVLFTFLCEKTVLPLQSIDRELKEKNLNLHTVGMEKEMQRVGTAPVEKEKGTNLVWIMPVSLMLGLAGGVFGRSILTSAITDRVFIFFLMILYVCVGVSQGTNKEVFRYVRMLGVRILWLPAAILGGSLVGGVVSGLLLHLPFRISLLSAGGMSFYSITGAFMTSTYGLETGAYGFIGNVMREFLTLLAMPVLIRISPGSPIAGGAAGDMDTMLAPVTKFVGVRLGLVALITGTVLTFLVPFLLPLLSALV